MIELNPDEQEAAAEFIRIMKRLQVELDDVSNKFAVFQACAARASGPLHAEHILLRKHLGNELGTIANVQLGIDSPAM
jgi:hypothetical protein